MSTHNFFIDATIDGRTTRVTGGPRATDGGFAMKVSMRDNGGIEIPLRVEGRYNPKDNTLILQAFNEFGAKVFERITQR